MSDRDPNDPREAATIPDHGGARQAPVRPSLASERYQLEGEIARGGMGRVVEAFDRELDRHVAIKEALTDDGDTLLRFKREIWITARLEHPAIVPLYDAGTRSDGTPFYVMRKIGGRPLVELVEEAPSVEARLALVPHVLAAARAIAHAHQRRVVHRDLKPSNILVGELGETVVIDWGLAKLFGEIDEGREDPPAAPAVETRIGTVMGTPGFMPPEQVAGGEADPRVDVYALGATLYFVLGRQLPHADTSTLTMLYASRHPATPIGDLVPEVPRDLEAIVEVAISPDPARRFADAGAMATELERFLAGQLIASRRYTPFERLIRFVRRHRVAVITAVIATLVLAIGGALAFDRVLTARAHAEDALDQAVHEREVAQELLSTMTLDRARSLVASNPTAAVALARPLATGPRWREVRAIVAAAEPHGIASSMPGPAAVAMIELAPTAPHAAIVDTGGHVWLYDLVAHQVHQLGGYTVGKTRIEFLGDRALAISEPGRTTVVDLPGRARRSYPVGGLITASAGHVLVHQYDHQVVELELPAGTVRTLGTFPEDAGTFFLSPDGEWLLLRVKGSILVVERATGGVVHELAFGPALARWHPTRSDRFVVSESGKVTVVTFDRGSVQRREIATRDFGSVAFSGERLCYAGAETTGMLDPVDARVPDPKGGQPIVGTGAHGLCYTPASTKISVVGDVLPRELISPIQIRRIAVAPRNPYVVASAANRLIAWRVPARARWLADSFPAALWPVGDHGLMFGMTSAGGTAWHHIDLPTGKRRLIPLPPNTVAPELVADLAGEVIAFHDVLRHRSIFVALRDDRFEAVPGDPAILASHGRAVLIDGEHRVIVVGRDLVPTEVTRHSTPATVAYVSPTSLGVAWSDHELWASLPTGIRTRHHARPVVDLAIAETGEVYLVTDDNALEVWSPDGTVAPVAKPSIPIDQLLGGERDHVLVLLRGGVLTRIDRFTGAEHRLATGGNLSLALQGNRALVPRGSDTVVYELDIGTSWSLELPESQVAPILSNDGRWVAFQAQQALYALPLAVPDSPAELAAHIDTLTNGEVDRTAPSSVIRWRD